MKVNGEGQSAIMTAEQMNKILTVADDVSKMILQILRYTGERPKAVLTLKQINCYYINNTPRDKIIFPGSSRKKAAGKKAKERIVFVIPQLQEVLENYKKPSSIYMFPSPRNWPKPISYHCFRARFETFLKQCRLDSHNISLYSYRRTFVTTMARQGLTLADLMNATGHQSTSSVQRYIEVDTNAVQKAMMFLE